MRLPFVNMSDDSGNEYFSDGISRGYISTLRIAQEWPCLKPLEGDPRY